MDEKLDYQFANNAKSLWKAHQLFNKKKKVFMSCSSTIHLWSELMDDFILSIYIYPHIKH